MLDLQDGQSVEIQGSARLPYILKNIGGVYSCSCPAWRNTSLPIERRTCKHLRQYRGEQAEQQRLGNMVASAKPASTKRTVPELLLAEAWDTTRDIAGWWLSEKLDGVRALWDGRQFLSRQGNIFHAPSWFVASLPKTRLDGELWLARKAFQRTVSIVRRQDQSDLWSEVRYLVFDAPDVAEPFEGRMQCLRDCFAEHRPQYAQLLAQEPCRGANHLTAELDRIAALGGEGLMLREPGSRYEAGRSPTLLKVKRFHDAEARVIEHVPGRGRHRGRLGALLVTTPNGTTFSVGTGFTDAQREHPPAVGSLITFRFQELTDRGVPRFPTFVRTGSDVADAY
jgi:DNA ligase-1